MELKLEIYVSGRKAPIKRKEKILRELKISWKFDETRRRIWRL